MSYSCTSTEAVCNSQDVSSASLSLNGHSSCSVSGGSDSSITITNSPSEPDSESQAAMKVKTGCNATDAGVPVTTEEELVKNSVITPEDVLGLQNITTSK